MTISITFTGEDAYALAEEAKAYVHMTTLARMVDAGKVDVLPEKKVWGPEVNRPAAKKVQDAPLTEDQAAAVLTRMVDAEAGRKAEKKTAPGERTKAEKAKDDAIIEADAVAPVYIEPPPLGKYTAEEVTAIAKELFYSHNDGPAMLSTVLKDFGVAKVNAISEDGRTSFVAAVKAYLAKAAAWNAAKAAEADGK